MKMRALIVAGMIVTAGAANAGTLIATYNYELGVTNVKFNTDLPGGVGPRDQGTTRFHGVRTGGTDTLVPNDFRAYCVEIGETLGEGGQTHNYVTNLLGSTTTGGGISGPVTFDATRTANLQKLWGNFYGSIGGNAALSAAFQLAQWEITFDNDMTLVSQTGAKMWVEVADAQAGITDVAQGWLDAITGGTAVNQQQLALISSENLQDLVTPVPEPATFAVMGLGLLAALKRRRK